MSDDYMQVVHASQQLQVLQTEEAHSNDLSCYSPFYALSMNSLKGNNCVKVVSRCCSDDTCHVGGKQRPADTLVVHQERVY